MAAPSSQYFTRPNNLIPVKTENTKDTKDTKDIIWFDKDYSPKQSESIIQQLMLVRSSQRYDESGNPIPNIFDYSPGKY